jgi:disulfide bond formation protein DsbB
MSDARRYTLLVLVLSAGIVGAALASQHWGGLQPCMLCLYERWPYYGALALTILAAFAGDRATTPWVLALCALLYASGAVLAFYHVGVEQHWFQGPTTCSGPNAGAQSVEQLKAQILGQKPVRCDEIPWSLFGISLAGWNLIVQLGLVALCLYACFRLRASERHSA